MYLLMQSWIQKWNSQLQYGIGNFEFSFRNTVFVLNDKGLNQLQSQDVIQIDKGVSSVSINFGKGVESIYAQL